MAPINYELENSKQMTVAKALKTKNRLVKKINTLTNRIYEYNSIPDGNRRPYDMEQLLNEIGELRKKLVDLKAKVHRANEPVFEKIFRLSELKSYITSLNSVDTTTGVDTGWGSSEVTHVAQIGPAELNVLIDGVQAQIDDLQDELDEWNAKTQI